MQLRCALCVSRAPLYIYIYTYTRYEFELISFNQRIAVLLHLLYIGAVRDVLLSSSRTVHSAQSQGVVN